MKFQPDIPTRIWIKVKLAVLDDPGLFDIQQGTPQKAMMRNWNSDGND